ncbi:MAG: PqqD family peptide modification chaperone [archaeon]|nr:PqqD family peptide modification chaperone [archaeon]MCP8306569.1 PqqD family peptide modification chaperone [archaeon]
MSFQIEYDPPAIGSLIPLRSRNSDEPGAELIEDLGAILVEKGLITNEMVPKVQPKVHKIQLSEYIYKKPIRKHKEHWVDGGNQIAVIHPETYLPFLINSSGSKICRLCDGERSIGDIIVEIKAEWNFVPEKNLVKDIIKILLLLEELDFVEFEG